MLRVNSYRALFLVATLFVMLLAGIAGTARATNGSVTDQAVVQAGAGALSTGSPTSAGFAVLGTDLGRTFKMPAKFMAGRHLQTWFGCWLVAGTAASLVWGAGWWWVHDNLGGFFVNVGGRQAMLAQGTIEWLLTHWNWGAIYQAMRWVYNC